ncbi:Rieske (2Fe-2S) protein [Intrasporangium calvum]|uniref:Rieske (2Fe-2S) protein n=1 Tax=Intrasporangium calvum TaxID=53358 RepID=UPI0002EDB9E4|nr:Rieske (2Fe-2S) protein [Intrasporangium calvum]
MTARRSVLLGAAAAGTLAACSSPPVPAPSAGSPDGAGGTPLSEIPVGGGKIFAQQKVVVTQPTAGVLKAFSTTCPHQGCAVTSIRDGQIICPCHGSTFDIASGAPSADSQAKQPLAARSITRSGDTFTIT